MKKILLAFFMATVALSSCCHNSTRLRTGDLLFVGYPAAHEQGDSTMSAAIADATGCGEISFVHAAMIEVCGDTTFIIDATTKRGVARYPLDTFVVDFTGPDGSRPVMEIKRVKGATPKELESYIANAKKYLGMPYDFHFLPGNDAYYCTELIRDCYARPDSTHVFAANPMNFKGPDGEYPPFWKNMFEKLGEPIPQGIEGTNPQDMSAEACLETVNTTDLK